MTGKNESVIAITQDKEGVYNWMTEMTRTEGYFASRARALSVIPVIQTNIVSNLCVFEL